MNKFIAVSSDLLKYEDERNRTIQELEARVIAIDVAKNAISVDPDDKISSPIARLAIAGYGIWA